MIFRFLSCPAARQDQGSQQDRQGQEIKLCPVHVSDLYHMNKHMHHLVQPNKITKIHIMWSCDSYLLVAFRFLKGWFIIRTTHRNINIWSLLRNWVMLFLPSFTPFTKRFYDSVSDTSSLVQWLIKHQSEFVDVSMKRLVFIAVIILTGVQYWEEKRSLSVFLFLFDIKRNKLQLYVLDKQKTSLA